MNFLELLAPFDSVVCFAMEENPRWECGIFYTTHKKEMGKDFLQELK
jgi:hypothetical protein